HPLVSIVGLLGADEDADAMLRLGIIVAQGLAGSVRDEAVCRQRMQRLLPRGIVGDLNMKAGGRQIKAVLLQGWPAWRFDRERSGGAKPEHYGRKHPQAVHPK